MPRVVPELILDGCIRHASIPPTMYERVLTAADIATVREAIGDEHLFASYYQGDRTGSLHCDTCIGHRSALEAANIRNGQAAHTSTQYLPINEFISRLDYLVWLDGDCAAKANVACVGDMLFRNYTKHRTIPDGVMVRNIIESAAGSDGARAIIQGMIAASARDWACQYPTIAESHAYVIHPVTAGAWGLAGAFAGRKYTLFEYREAKVKGGMNVQAV